jgi:transposase InsO family protein
VTKLKQGTQRPANQLRDLIRLFQPETVLRWHRQLIRRKWTYDQHHKGGRPPLDHELEALVVRLAQENDRWGYGKIEGELLKLGHKVSQTTIRNILDRHGIVPAPVRNGSLGWRKLMTHYKQQLLACDFFTVETLWLQTLYVLFYIKVGTRRVYLAGITAHPDGFWVAQQARQYVWTLEQKDLKPRFLIHDNDRKFTKAHDTVFRSEHIHIISTPFQAPNANSFAERWVRTAREECLNHLLIFNENHLRRVLQTFIDYYNTTRPHQGIQQQSPVPRPQPTSTGPVQRTMILGFISDYYCGSDQTALCPA